MKKILLALFLALILGFSGQAQDPVYNQFYNAPLFTNPALTGAFQGRWRAGINYRDTWTLPLNGNPYRTAGGSFDIRFKGFDRDFFAVGIKMLNDRSGENNFTVNRFSLSGAYLKELAGTYGGFNSYLSLGFQAGVGKHSNDSGDYWFYDQYDPGSRSVSATSPNAPNISDATDLYINGNIGLLWYAVFDEKKSIYVGGAYFHANNPEISFLNNGDVKLEPRLMAHAGAELPLGKSFSLLPNIMYTTQASNLILSPGFNLRYSSQYFRELALRAGVWMRMTNTFDSKYIESYIPSIMFEYENWLIGLSYEVNVTPINTVNNGRGGVELSVYYVQRDANFRTPLRCPKF